MYSTMTDDRIRELLDGAEFHSLFLELGWDNPPDTGRVRVKDVPLDARRVAAKKGVAVWLVLCADTPHAREKRRVSLELRKHSPLGRLVLFDTPEEVTFLWPERTQSGRDRLVDHVYLKHRGGGDAVLQRLRKARFALAEHKDLTPLDALDRVRYSFNVEKVTRSFYREFNRYHQVLMDRIEGIIGETDRHWYASVLMNRLMFIYFIQRKEFMDGDQNYLRSRLAMVRQYFGADQFYAFFRDFLLPLFHQGLGSATPEFADPAIRHIVGRVPYINGGIFEIHSLEQGHDIRIEDAVFERLFDCFDKWRWHLDESPTGDPKEISPDILGFIFEQYVNQKDQGAYYTKPDVTGYMSISAILPALVDRLVEAGLEDPCVLLPGSGSDIVRTRARQ